MSQGITEILGQIRGGYALAEAGKKIQECVAAVRNTNKAGEVTFTIKIAPDKNDERVVTMTPSIKAKIPEKGMSAGIFFVGPDGRLTREDPAQLELLEERRKSGVATLARDEANLSKVGTGTGT